METRTEDKLVFSVTPPKSVLYLYWGSLIAVNSFFIFFYIYMYIYNFGADTWSLILLFFVDLLLIPNTLRAVRKKYIVTIDNSKNSIEIKKNNSVNYVSNYPLRNIQTIKTVIKRGGIQYLVSSLIFVLKNHEEEIVYKSDDFARLLFYIDIEANMQAEIGKRIAEFLSISYTEEVY